MKLEAREVKRIARDATYYTNEMTKAFEKMIRLPLPDNGTNQLRRINDNYIALESHMTQLNQHFKAWKESGDAETP